MASKKKKKKPPMYSIGGGRVVPLPTVVTPEDLPDDLPHRYLRYAAGIYYTTDLNGCSVEDMGRHPIYGAVPITTLRRWSLQDEWHKRRESNREQWRKKIEVAIGSQLAQARVKQLQSLQRVYDQALAKLESDAAEAGTWEGMATVLLKIAELMDGWRTKMAQEIWPTMVESAAPSDNTKALVRPKLSKEEARAAAMLIIQKRREQKAKADQEATEEAK